MNKNNKTAKFHLRKGDKVRILAGNDKGYEGLVLKVFKEKQRAIVEGANIKTKAVKPTSESPEGGFDEIEAPIHISNLMVVNPETGFPARTGRKRNDEGKLERYFKSNSQRAK